MLQIQAIPICRQSGAMKRFLGLSDSELAENERLWREENAENITMSTNASGEMRSAGVSGAGIDADIAGAEDTASMTQIPTVNAGATDTTGGADTALGGVQETSPWHK